MTAQEIGTYQVSHESLLKAKDDFYELCARRSEISAKLDSLNNTKIQREVAKLLLRNRLEDVD